MGEKHAEAAEKAAKEAAKKEKDGKEAEKPAAGSSAMDVDGDEKPPLATLYERVKAAHGRGAMSTATLMAAYAHRPPPPPEILMEKDAEGKPKAGSSAADELAEPKLEAEVLENPARVLRAQEKHIAPLHGSRYVPISAGRRAGIVVLKDTTPDEAEDLLLAAALPVPGGGNPDEEEPEPPAPFEFTAEAVAAAAP